MKLWMKRILDLMPRHGVDIPMHGANNRKFHDEKGIFVWSTTHTSGRKDETWILASGRILFLNHRPCAPVEAEEFEDDFWGQRFMDDLEEKFRSRCFELYREEDAMTWADRAAERSGSMHVSNCFEPGLVRVDTTSNPGSSTVVNLLGPVELYRRAHMMMRAADQLDALEIRAKSKDDLRAFILEAYEKLDVLPVASKIDDLSRGEAIDLAERLTRQIRANAKVDERCD